jgi:Ser/Thr protein kinase RdoA (MazF antagonist)
VTSESVCEQNADRRTLTFGLVDFDDAVGGPAVIDLLRFGVGLH